MKTITFSTLLESLKSFFRWLETQNYLLILGVPFVLIIPRAILAGDNPIGDESSFYEPIKTFGLNAFSVIENTKNLRVPQGPGFFAVYGFFGSFVDYSLPALRFLNIFVSYLVALILFKILCKLSNFPIILTLWFVLNPYFLLLTTPYIYTDNLCLFFLISGTYFFIVKDQRLLAGLCWSLAIWTRQLAIFVPIAAILTDFYFDRHNLKQQVRAVLDNSLPLLATMVLFLLWGYSLTPPNNEYTNSTETFAFSLRQLNYAIILTGVCATPLWLPNLRQLFRVPYLSGAIIFLPSIFFRFPRRVNQDAEFWTMETAGYFDKTLIWIGDFAFLVVPFLWIVSLAFLFRHLAPALNSRTHGFAILCIVFFWGIEAVYTFAWDKYFLMIIPFLLLLQEKKTRAPS